MACGSACISGNVVGDLLLLCRAFLTESSLHTSINMKKRTEGFKSSVQMLGWLFGTPPESYLLCRVTLAESQTSLLHGDPSC